MCDNEDRFRVKHLEFIQDVITRMNENSFQIKGWVLTLVTVSLIAYALTTKVNYILLGVFPTVALWVFDSYYLWQERKFRGLYTDVAKKSQNPLINLFQMRPDLYTGGKYSFWNVLFSITIVPFYVSIVIFLIGVYIYSSFVS